MSELCALYADEGLIPDAKRYQRYLDVVFGDVHFEGATVLDVGSGTGLVSCYAAARGAKRVVSLEPEFEGSSGASHDVARRLAKAAGMNHVVETRRESIHDFAPDGEMFDVVVLHNSINHLNEAACVELLENAESRLFYETAAAKIATLTRRSGTLFVSDCSPRNLWPALGLRNPFARKINWRLHQSPGVWIGLLTSAGFSSPRLRWTPPGRLPPVAQRIAANRLVAFVGSSHFHLLMRRT